MSTNAMGLEREWRQAIRQLGIALEPLDIEMKIHTHPACQRFRTAALLLDNSPSHITGSTFWSLRATHRFDILAHELGQIVSRLKLSIGLSQLYLPHLAPTAPPPFAPGFADRMFWHEVDSGFRLISSGWDRIALLVDLVFGLGLNDSCHIKKAMKKLRARKCDGHEPYAALNQYLATEFLEIEGEQRGMGVRHESTHIFSMTTRHFMETLEGYGRVESSAREQPPQMHQDLVRHFQRLLTGIDDALNLIQACSSPGAQ